MADDLDVRPVVVDKLVEFTDQALAQRVERLVVLCKRYEERVASQEEALAQSRQLFRFVQDEQEKAKLAQALKCGDIVRVVCPSCQGSGLKPIDATSGRVQRKSAFETIGSETKPESSTDIDPAERCKECQGKKFVLMDRFKG
jgi:hypothetical protein